VSEMAIQDVEDHYPTVRHAVMFCEILGPESWGLLRAISPKEALTWLRWFAGKCAVEQPGSKMPLVLAEMDRPEFLVYFKGKTGAV
jgi:hypothetical protein